MPSLTSVDPIAALRAAYQSLPEETKRRISRTFFDRRPADFENLSKWAKTGYHNVQVAAQRPAGVGHKLDQYLLRTQSGFALLRIATKQFFFSEKKHWIDFITVRIEQESPITVSAKLDEILSMPDAPWRDDPLEVYFKAASRAKPTDWLPKDSPRTTPLSPIPQPVAELPPAVGEGLWRQFEATERDLLELIEAARSIRPFNPVEAAARLQDLALASEALRRELAALGTAAGETTPEWRTAAEFKAVWNRFARSGKRVRAEELRRLLLRLADHLDQLTDVGSRSERRRQEVKLARQEAAAELREVAAKENPPALPGAETPLWLQTTFGLAGADLDRRCCELDELGMGKLAAFIQVAEAWDRFAEPRPSADLAAVSSATAPPAIVVLEPPSIPANSLVLTDSMQPVAEAAGPSSSISVSPPIAAEVAKSVSRPPAFAPEAIPGFTDCLATLRAIDEIEDARVLLPDVIESLPTELLEYLPAAELWRALASQPWLDDKENNVHENLRLDLGTLVDSGWSARSEFEAVLEWAAILYPAFLGTVPQANALIYPLTQNKYLPSPFAAFTRQTAAFLSEVPHCSPEGILKGTMHSDWSAALEALRTEITQGCESAAQQTLNYQKATQVWRKINGPGGRLREIAQRTSGRPSPEILRKLRADATEILSPKIQQRLIETVGRTISSNFPNIDGAALEQLSVRFEEFARRLLRFCDHAFREPKESLYTSKVHDFSTRALPLLRALSLSIATDPRTSPSAKLASRIAHRAAQRVIALFDTNAPARSTVCSHDEALIAARLRMIDLPLDPRTFAPAEDRESDVRVALQASRFQPVEVALRRRLETGEIASARRLVEHLEPGADGAEWIARIEDARETHAAECLKELEHVRRDVLNARMLGVMNESVVQEHLTRLTSVQAQVQSGEDFAAPARIIQLIKDQLHQHTAAQAAKLNEELASLPTHPPETRNRVGRLLQSGDLATAREYITRLQGGLELPPLGLDEPLGGFTTILQAKIVEALATNHEFDGFLNKVQGRSNFAGLKFDGLAPARHKELIEWLQAWRALRTQGGLDRGMILRWLGGLGFRPLEVHSHAAGSEVVADVKMEVVADRAICPVPQFGSEARGHYRLVHLAKRQDAAQYLQILRQAGSNQAVILLAAYRVEPQMRLEYARICRENRLRGLLVDEVLVVYLSSLNSNRLAAMFTATLPYTWVDPYVPTSSFVPPEMFFGRAGALEALLDMSKQRCFVYGGRQLGKTALLREVERRFPTRYKDGTALWIDLQAEDFGIKAEPEEIWLRLNERFCEKVSGFEALWRDTKGAAHVRFELALARWLERNSDRRLLLLLDECDRFLEREAAHDFAQTRRLKDLMGRWSGRLKIVFAGLHNVQRSTRHANHPLAHLGDPISVGSFSQNGEWMEAYALVAGPLAALGFKFESADLPSRVLAACNFYPSLLQQFGHRLLDRCRSQSRHSIPRVVDAEALDAVLREDEFRRFMTDRFQLTLQLDPRYYYIAYAFALFFHDEPVRATKGYTSGELRDKMEYWRPAEFTTTVGHEEFDALLDEMQGLGILQRGEDQRYRLRNTNVLLLLGTADEVLRRLAEDLPDLKVDFQSQSHRGRVAENRRRLFTRPEENRLLDRRHQVSLFSCAPVAESATFEESLRAAAHHDHCHFVPATTAEAVKKSLEDLAGQKQLEGTHVILLDHRPKDALHVSACIELAREFVLSRHSKIRFFSLAIHIPPGQLWDLETRSWIGLADLTFYFGRRWEQEFVGPWLQDQSFSISSADLTELMTVTDGWPRLLHDFVADHRTKNSWPEALDAARRKVERWSKDPAVFAKFMGEGAAATTAGKHFRDLFGIEPGSFSSADVATYAQLQDLSPALMQHWVEIASRLGLIDRTAQTYRWSRVFSQILAG